VSALAERYGWRGLWLMLMGTVWFLFGIGTLMTPVAPRSWVLHEHIPSASTAAIWMASGALAVRVGLRGAGRDDSAGHVALYLPVALRVVSFWLSWLVWLASSLTTQLGLTATTIGYRDAWYSALVWSLVSVMLAITSRWPNPVPPLPAPPTCDPTGGQQR
jgi:hypothetical protein